MTLTPSGKAYNSKSGRGIMFAVQMPNTSFKTYFVISKKELHDLLDHKKTEIETLLIESDKQ